MKINHKMISDHMVLQRGEAFSLTGETDATNVTVNMNGKVYEANVNQGNFEAIIPADDMVTGGPYELTINEESNTVTYKDVLIGDVFFMAGQSNMEFPVSGIYANYKDQVDEFDSEFVRQFKVPTSYDFHEIYTDVPAGKWVNAIGDDKADFGAIGFFMAKKLYLENKVPIGLIQVAVPGCPIESFISEENLKTLGIEFDVSNLNNKWMAEKIQEENDNWNSRVAHLLSEDEKINHTYKKTIVPVLIDCDEDSCAGVFTFKRKVNLKNVPEEDGILKLGLIVEIDETYVNGVKVGTSEHQYLTRRYTVPKSVLKQGENEIVIKVIATNGICRLWEKLEYSLTVGDETIDLTGVWEYSKGYFEKEEFFTRTFFEYKPIGCYNAMIAPFEGLKAKGILFYQGESNTDKPEGYKEKFEVFINQVRKLFDQPELPIYYVQLAGYEDINDEGGYRWEALRLEQEKAQSIKNAYMIISKDVGSPTDLHPQNKLALGERIANLI